MTELNVSRAYPNALPAYTKPRNASPAQETEYFNKVIALALPAPGKMASLLTASLAFKAA